MNAKELQKILSDHVAWLLDNKTGARASLVRASLGAINLSRADLSKADLRGAYLRGAHLSGAYFSGADLSRADLSGAYLRGTDLSKADLRGADLSGAYLGGADLSKADINGADLRGANLRRADLNGIDTLNAIGIISIGPGGSRGDMLYAVKHDDCIMVKTGCWWGTLDEFAEAVKSTHGRNEHGRYYLAAIKLIKATARLAPAR